MGGDGGGLEWWREREGCERDKMRRGGYLKKKKRERKARKQVWEMCGQREGDGEKESERERGTEEIAEQRLEGSQHKAGL